MVGNLSAICFDRGILDSCSDGRSHSVLEASIPLSSARSSDDLPCLQIFLNMQHFVGWHASSDEWGRPFAPAAASQLKSWKLHKAAGKSAGCKHLSCFSISLIAKQLVKKTPQTKKTTATWLTFPALYPETVKLKGWTLFLRIVPSKKNNSRFAQPEQLELTLIPRAFLGVWRCSTAWHWCCRRRGFKSVGIAGVSITSAGYSTEKHPYGIHMYEQRYSE